MRTPSSKNVVTGPSRALAMVLLSWLTATSIALPARGQGPSPETPREPWAEPGLKVTKGLALWLDAGRLVDARKALGKGSLNDGDKVDVWYDASGRGRHVAQSRPEAQPVYQDGAVRFDGDKAALEWSQPGWQARDLTIFVVAAPFTNSGDFRGFLALNQSGKNDYVSGLNLDLGPASSRRFATFNVEGNGFGGATNLITTPSDFGVIRRIGVTSTPGRGGTRVFFEGREAGRRDRADSILHGDHLTVGARRYNNEGGAPNVRGVLDGDLLEILAYDRILSDDERAEVDRYLAARYERRPTITPPERPGVGKRLVYDPNPPDVRMLVPGFRARPLPVDLPNINNIKYRADGKLVALAYDGNIYLVSGGKETGLEDKVEVFWENKGALKAPIGMALTPPGDPHGRGVYVACMGKVSLILDTDGDDRGDREVVVADGWKITHVSVDALGVAVGRDGRVYFGLGTEDFTNAYVVNKEGQAQYNLKGERGAILRVSPDFKTREVIASGIRFPVALAFNRAGDLFATDQEGATWLSNGNPFDELLHIQEGRHYGFPPRHPRHLPGVIDEPSVFDYSPQHQSTCGLNFNQPVNGGPTFGPEWWADDAIVSGYSRGKLYRTELAKSPSGYVAKNQILACLNMLTVDACVSPQGDLVVATHSGLPDWGSGPSGKGRLYKISYTDKSEPQPVIAWPSGPQEVRVAFDRPLDPARLRDLTRRTTIEYGKAVRPSDRFESLRPGYEVVSRQMAAPRFELPVLSAQVSDDRRTLVLATPRHPEASAYALTLRTQEGPEPAAPGAPSIDLGYDLTGVEASWHPESGAGGWDGWLPHLNLAVAAEFTAKSAEHERFRQALDRPGRLTLRTKLDLEKMLRPAVQPGSTVDARLPDEVVVLVFTGSRRFEVTTAAGRFSSSPVDATSQRVAITVRPKASEWTPVEIVLETGPATSFDLSYSTQEDPRDRAFPLRRFLLPWASAARPMDMKEDRTIPELKGGDWAKGRALFYGDEARCSACHQVRGRGGRIGPDLSNLIHRDYASVLRDIRTPSAAINPDYIAHAIALKDGRVLQGTLRSEGDRLLVGEGTGVSTPIDRSDVESQSPSPLSIMPTGLDGTLGEAKLRDLLTFLLTEPLRPAPVEGDAAPPPRRRAEVEAVLKDDRPVIASRTLRVVLAGGPKDHGPGEHDYPLWQKRWSALLPLAEGVTVSTAEGWPTPQQFTEAAVIVFYSNNPAWSSAKVEQLDRYLARGGGLVYLHYAVDGHNAVEALSERIGLAWKGGASKFRHGKLALDLRGSTHPITRGFGVLNLVDESYWNLSGDPSGIDVLGTGVEEGKPQPLVWTRQQGKGRIFVSIPGHYTWTFDDPLFRILILRGIAWASGAPVERLDELATPGARLVD